MTEEEVLDRAVLVRQALTEVHEGLEAGPMEALLWAFRTIAQDVVGGEYHRGHRYGEAVRALDRLGFDVSGEDLGERPESASVAEAARNACNDTHDLWALTNLADVRWDSPMGRAVIVVSDADDLMACLVDGERDVREWAACLRQSVSRYLEGTGHAVPAERSDTGTAVDPPGRPASHGDVVASLEPTRVWMTAEDGKVRVNVGMPASLGLKGLPVETDFDTARRMVEGEVSVLIVVSDGGE